MESAYFTRRPGIVLFFYQYDNHYMYYGIIEYWDTCCGKTVNNVSPIVCK